MNREAVLVQCDAIDAATCAIRVEVTAPTPTPPDLITLVPAGSDLQAALDLGGLFVLEGGATFHGAYRIAAPRTVLSGVLGGCALDATDSARVVTVPMLMANAVLAHVHVSSRNEVAVLIGENTTAQNAVDLVPRQIVLHGVTSAGHRGKRCIEVNAADVWIVRCDVRDLYDPENLDSQAVWIGNAPGPVTIDGGHFEAASECLMVGGDTMKIPGCRPTGITIREALFTKPLAWREQGIKVKNLLELKDGHDVLIERCQLCQCWKSAQDGYAFMFTPTCGGSLRNVVVRDCAVWDVGGIVNITGRDADLAGPRTQVAIYGGDYRTNKAAMGGSGRFCLIGRGPESFVVEGATIAHEGSAFIDIGDSEPVDLLRIVGSTWNYGSYGIRIGGLNHGDNSRGQVQQLVVEGNTISGAHGDFRERFPLNTYVGTYREDV